MPLQVSEIRILLSAYDQDSKPGQSEEEIVERVQRVARESIYQCVEAAVDYLIPEIPEDKRSEAKANFTSAYQKMAKQFRIPLD